MAFPNGPAIRLRRQRTGKTISQLAEAVGCSYVHMANVEGGHNTASTELLWRVVNFLGLEDIAEIELPHPPTAAEGPGSHESESQRPPGRPDPSGPSGPLGPPGHPDRDAA